MFQVSVTETFSSGHALRGYKGKCENVHGHNYRIQVIVAGEKLDSTGLLMDFVDLRGAIKGVAERLDHRFLNDLAPFDTLNPSAENLAQYFFEQLQGPIGANRLRVSPMTGWG